MPPKQPAPSAPASEPRTPAPAAIGPARPPLDQQIIQVTGFFISHAMSEDQQQRAKNVRDAGQLLAETILKSVPFGADQTASIRKIREATMTAVQAISLEEYGK